MKKILTVVFTMLLGATLSFAQAAGGSTDPKPTDKKPATKSAKSGKKASAHKGGKKSKKSSSDTGTTTPPK